MASVMTSKGTFTEAEVNILRNMYEHDAYTSLELWHRAGGLNGVEQMFSEMTQAEAAPRVTAPISPEQSSGRKVDIEEQQPPKTPDVQPRVGDVWVLRLYQNPAISPDAVEITQVSDGGAVAYRIDHRGREWWIPLTEFQRRQFGYVGYLADQPYMWGLMTRRVLVYGPRPAVQ